MNRLRTNLGKGLRFGGLAALALLCVSSAWGETPGVEETWAKEHLSGVRIPFIANSGQTDSAVAYYAPTFVGTVFVTRDGQIVYSLPGEKASATAGHFKDGGWCLTETVVVGRARPNGGHRSSTHVSYFLGNDRSRWKSEVATFDDVFLGEVWPGISLDLRAHGKNVEKLFTVEPGGDPSRIRMRIAGAGRLRVNETGALVVGTGLGEVTFTAPEAFQERQGVRYPVLVAYELHGREYGFRLGAHDPKLPVVIDPFLQVTYLGGTGIDEAYALAIHPTSGEVYVAGYTASTVFPGTSGGAQASISTGNDAFVARLNSALTALDQATYLGGSADDRANALAIHPSTGDVYIAGQTTSTNFPGTAGGAQATNNGGVSTAAFVARLNSSLTTLTQSTYFGGGVTVAYALAIHPTTGDVYLSGSTIFSVLPGTTGAAQANSGGGVDGFVAHLNSALTTLAQATYLGGGGGETAYALAIQPTSGDVYVAGETDSTNLPGTVGGAQATHGVDFGNSDAFVAHLNAALTTLAQSTYLGGNNQEVAQALAIHPTTGDVYVAGWTESTNFPGVAGGAQTTSSGSDHGFVAHVNSALTALAQSTYLGGGAADRVFALAIHPRTGDVYVAGYTAGNFPATSSGAQAMFGGIQDAFVAHVNSALTTIDQATYLGGSSVDIAQALAINPTTGDVYVAGYTFSTNFPATAGGAQADNGGSYDAFVARLSASLTPSLLTVVCPGDSLQASIDAAQPGTTISVFGTCGENVLIRNEKQRITIDGGGTATINAPSAASPALNVRGKGILVQGFTIAGGSDGIEVNRGSNAVLNNNVIQNTAGNGVLVDQLSFTVITNNTIENNPGAGIFVSQHSTARIGFNLDTETTVSPNTIQNNALGVVVSNGSSARIIGNVIENNSGDGVLVTRDSHADLASDSIDGNGGDGIEVGDSSAVQLGEDSGASIYESANTTATNNTGFGIRCSDGGVADGRQGSLTGSSGTASFDGSCAGSLNP